jgi:capping protein beta
LTSTLILWADKSNSTESEFNMSGNLMKQKEQKMNLNMSSHLINIGKMIEDMEKHLCDSLKNVYFAKTFNILNCLFTNNQNSGDEKPRKASLVNDELLSLIKKKLL